ncbi:HIT family protein [Aquabacterium sp.]|uniref:HIT family protein n=1 Tax=Aquabacterium sp. TaxID=1872578 RepID=UPI0019A220B8|nr:HIT family protein [Aquabacterium sp.]MBC7701088.1 HIT family protein [Aquabacterium sp.]
MGQLDTTRKPGCALCVADGGFLVVRNLKLRVIRVLDVDYPGFYRVIWNDHAAEFTDLPTADRVYLMDVVSKVESLVREHLQPTKVNLASLGNVVPHLHWHVIARFADDMHFPQPIWGSAQREVAAKRWDGLRAELAILDTAIRAALS